jgi:hypothetical protein
MRHVRSNRPAVITSAPESLTQELDRRQRRYAVMAVIFVASFTVAALLHRDTALALLLCGVAMTTLVAAVIGANIRSPRRRPDSLARQGHQQPQLRSAPAEHPPAS